MDFVLKWRTLSALIVPGFAYQIVLSWTNGTFPGRSCFRHHIVNLLGRETFTSSLQTLHETETIKRKR